MAEESPFRRWLDRHKRKQDDGRPLDVGPETATERTEQLIHDETTDDSVDDLTEPQNPEHALADEEQEEAIRELSKPIDAPPSP